MIPAHSGQLAAIQFSPSGTRIATASDKGTVIRVFSVTGNYYMAKHFTDSYAQKFKLSFEYGEYQKVNFQQF